MLGVIADHYIMCTIFMRCIYPLVDIKYRSANGKNSEKRTSHTNKYDAIRNEIISSGSNMPAIFFHKQNIYTFGWTGDRYGIYKTAVMHHKAEENNEPINYAHAEVNIQMKCTITICYQKVRT